MEVLFPTTIAKRVRRRWAVFVCEEVEKAAFFAEFFPTRKVVADGILTNFLRF